jgi:hypothetical protein
VAIGNGITVTVDARNNTAQAFGSAAKGVKTVGEAADVAQRQLREMEAKLEAADTKARKLAQAEEQAAEKTRRLALSLAEAKRELNESGDASGKLSAKIDRLTTDTRFAAIATEEYRRAANRASNEAREQARAYDRVADNARQAARAVEHLGAASLLTRGGKGAAGAAAGGFLGGLADISGGLLKGGVGGASSAAEGVFGTPVVGPAALAVAVPAAAAAGTFIGAAAGGGVLGGAGLGVAGAGLAGAWMGDPARYQSKWDATIDHVQKRWIDSSKAFGKELDADLKIARQTLESLPIEKALALSHGLSTPIVAGAGAGIGNFAGGLTDSLRGAQEVVDTLGPKLAGLGHAAGDALRAISMGSHGGAEALGDFVDGISGAVRAAGILIMGLEDLYSGMRKTAKGAWDLATAIPGTGQILQRFANDAFTVNASQITIGHTIDKTGESAHTLGGKWLEMARAGAQAELAAQGLNDALTETRNLQLAAADANLALAQGWLDLAKGLKEGEKTLDTSKQAGIDNNEVILHQIELAEQARQQAIKTGGDTAQAIDEANQKYAENVERIRAAAIAAGFDKDKVDALIASLGALPPDTKANVTVNGLSSSLAQGISLGNALNRIDGQDYQANVYVYYHTKGQALNAPQRTGGIPHAATGGAQGRDTLVGEEGPEIVRLPSGSTVYPRANTAQMLAGGNGGGGGGVVSVVFGGDTESPMAQWFMRAQRRGDVQILSTAII